MVAFASNSLLNRLALLEGAIGPGGFAVIRVASGVVVLLVLLSWRTGTFPRLATPQPKAIVGLATYMLGFSFAYVSMDAGLGALILFGIVQVTMFAGALFEGMRPHPQRWAGMLLAMLGLGVLTWPSGPIEINTSALLLMAMAGIGWGGYSLEGRGVKDPVSATAMNFLYCLPIVAIVWLLVPEDVPTTTTGTILAIASGGITSALGYALWYALLPSLGATRGALAQLSAPAIALALGVVVLGEAVTVTALLAAGLILGGIAVGVVKIAKG